MYSVVTLMRIVTAPGLSEQGLERRGPRTGDIITIAQVCYQVLVVKCATRYYWESVLPGTIGKAYCQVLLIKFCCQVLLGKCSARYYWASIIPGTTQKLYCLVPLGKCTAR